MKTNTSKLRKGCSKVNCSCWPARLPMLLATFHTTNVEANVVWQWWRYKSMRWGIDDLPASPRCFMSRLHGSQVRAVISGVITRTKYHVSVTTIADRVGIRLSLSLSLYGTVYLTTVSLFFTDIRRRLNRLLMLWILCQVNTVLHIKWKFPVNSLWRGW